MVREVRGRHGGRGGEGLGVRGFFVMAGDPPHRRKNEGGKIPHGKVRASQYDEVFSGEYKHYEAALLGGGHRRVVFCKDSAWVATYHVCPVFATNHCQYVLTIRSTCVPSSIGREFRHFATSIAVVVESVFFNDLA